MKNRNKMLIFFCGFVVGLLGFIVMLVLVLKRDDTSEDLKGEEFVSKVNEITFVNIKSSINLGEVMPTLDKFGVLNDSFDFTIKNNGQKEKEYTLSLYDNNSTILNKMIRYELTKNQESLGIHTLSDEGIIDIGNINESEEISYSLKMWLDFNSDVKIGKLNKKIMISEGSDYFDNSKANSPILTDNLIPVYYDYEKASFYKSGTTNTYYNMWYNYAKDLYANAVTVSVDKQEEYINSPVGTRISLDDITSMWVWIPRFNYTMRDSKVSIDYVDIESKAHSAFTFDKEELPGFWITKYEAGIADDDDCVIYNVTSKCNNANKKLLFKPNISIMNRITMANLFYTIRKMELKGNIYGFSGSGIKVNNDGTISGDDNNIDIHMIKNSEWEAVSLLSLKKNIVSNNTNKTGMAFYNDNNYNFDIITYGEMASTTNNVSGIYDMVGGRCEYVMLKNDDLFTNKSNSGFTSLVKDYYYDSLIDSKMSSLLNLDTITYPVSRGGYKNVSKNILSFCTIGDYVNKVSLETNSRAVLSVFKVEENN